MLTETDANKLLTRAASHPFDGSEASDIVLRTSDNCDFYVHRIILSVASPFFKTMFSLPQPQTPESDITSRPIIGVPEHSNTLDPLLRICYPVDEPMLTSISLVGDMLEAAMKYEFTKAVNLLKKRLREYVPSSPLHVYAVSCRLKLEEIATMAARKWRLSAPDVDEDTFNDGNIVYWAKTTVSSSFTEEMSKISAGSFYRLIHYVRGGIVTSFCEHNATQHSNSSNVGTAPTGTQPFSIFGTSASLSSTPNRANDLLTNSAFKFADSDLIILSSDGLSFEVHKLILRLCAPSMIYNGKDWNHVGGKETVSVEEDGRTLSILLHISYPSMTIDPGLLTMPDISLALSAAIKYKMKNAIDKLKPMLKFSNASEALKIYFTFVQGSLFDEATEVARSDILLFTSISSLYIAEMEQVSARYYYHLLQHRHACLSALLVAGSKYKNEADRQWWVTMKANWSTSIRLAGPVVEKYFKSVNPSPSTYARSSTFGSTLSGDNFNLKKKNCTTKVKISKRRLKKYFLEKIGR